MSGRPGTSQLHRISALRASSAIAAGTPRAKSPPPRFSAFHPAHVVASQSLEPCTKSYRAPAQAHISQPIVAQVAHIAHTSNRPRQPPALHHTFLPTCRSDSRPAPAGEGCGLDGLVGAPHSPRLALLASFCPRGPRTCRDGLYLRTTTWPRLHFRIGHFEAAEGAPSALSAANELVYYLRF